MDFIQSFTHTKIETKQLLKELKDSLQRYLNQKILVLKNICLKYYDIIYRIWKKMKRVFVMMNLASVTVTME